MPATSAGLPRLLFLLWSLTVLMKQRRRAVRAIKQSILLRCLCGRLSTADLLIKIVCFGTEKNILSVGKSS